MSESVTAVATASAERPTPAADDPDYRRLEARLRERVAAVTGPLFTTDADPEKLWGLYLDALPRDRRKHYECHACRRFVQTYGGLVTVSVGGDTTPLLWEPTDALPFFSRAITQLDRAVAAAKVTGVFLSDKAEWGTPRTGEWSHLSATNPKPFAPPPGKTASQVMAEKKEDYGVLARSLADYPLAAAEQAVRVLAHGSLTRSEKAQGVADWYLALHRRLDGVKDKRRRDHLVWAAVATAPPGFTHVRTEVLGTLLDDIQAGLPFEDIARRWAEKLHPLQYQRPTAPVTAGQIDHAEKVFAERGYAPALARRYATLDDVGVKLWVPPTLPPEQPAGGVFGHLRAQPDGVKPVALPAVRTTWVKFRTDVLPTARRIDVQLSNVAMPFFGLLTAANPAAPPILQWDGEPRNPVSWYFHSGGSLPASWGLSGPWAEVTAVFLNPPFWHHPDRFTHQNLFAGFALKGCVEREPRSLCLFPEIMKAELREVRAVVEAHSNRTRPTGAADGTANGLAFQKGGRAMHVRVHTAGGPAEYTLDRWE